jgi:hypothetical protein
VPVSTVPSQSSAAQDLSHITVVQLPAK